MSEPRRLKAKIANYVPDGAIIAHCEGGEHLILELGWAQICALKSDLDKYVVYETKKGKKA